MPDRRDSDNAYCSALGIAVPTMEAVIGHRDASHYALLIVALLEHGAPLTLPQVAARFEAAGFAAAPAALASLKRCRPARAPVYRHGDDFGLDVHHDELDLWLFRLGLRPARVAPPPPPAEWARPDVDQPLTIAELDEAWRGAGLGSWSALRLTLAVLEAHGHAMAPGDVVAFITARTPYHALRAETQAFRTSAAIAIDADGRWRIGDAAAALAGTRTAVRDAVERVRRLRPRATADDIAAMTRAAALRRAAHGAELAALRRVIVHGVPGMPTAAGVIVDVASRTMTTWIGDELAAVRRRLDDADIIAAIDVRAVLAALGVEIGQRRVADLAPPQRSVVIGRRSLPLTTALLVTGSCRIARPFDGDPGLVDALARAQHAHVRRRLEADGRALHALYQYGRLHGALRVRAAGIDDMLPAVWHHRDEPTLHDITAQAADLDVTIDAVVGPAPAWDDPWARAERLRVIVGARRYPMQLVDDNGQEVDERDIQLARLGVTVH